MPRAVLSIAVACAVATAGCRDASGLGPMGGRGAENLGPVDATDAYESPRRDGGVAHDAGTVDAARIDAAPDAGNNEMACDACEAAQCRNVDGLDLYAMCFLATGNASEGPGAGRPKSDLCRQVLHCARATGCAAVDPQPCYCGEGVSDLQCLAGSAHGPCKTDIEIAAESANPGVIASRVADPDFAAGAAFNLLRYCEAPICGSACAGSGGPIDAGVPPDAPPPDAPPPDAPPPTCADLDHDGISDCQETLVTNARFDRDIASWTAEFGAAAAWDGAHDGLGDPTSGSIAVTNAVVASMSGTTRVAASQCVPVTTGASYRAAAQVLIAPGQGPGSAGVSAYFHGSADCAGPIIGVWSSALTSATGAWTTISSALVAPAGARSIRVRLAIDKPFPAPALEAHFDNVLFEKP